MSDDNFTRERHAYLCEKFGIQGKLELDNSPDYQIQNIQDWIDEEEARKQREYQTYTAFGACNHKHTFMGKLFLEITPDR